MMLDYTRHARTRMQQRGFSGQDIDLIVACGTLLRPGLYMLRNRDADREIQELRLRIQDIERNRGRAAVVQDGALVTCYRLSGPAGRRAMRRVAKCHKHPGGTGMATVGSG